jgi:UDP-N-acetylglucosamine 2-epimerase
MKSKIVFIVGTRPELIKVYPVIHQFEQNNFTDYVLVNTGQHKDMLDPFWDFFKLKPHYTLDVMQPGQSLSSLLAKSLNVIEELLVMFRKDNIEPKLFVAQGDTTTVMASSLVAFYNKIPFYHLEAGLRTHNLHHPFPEELNRKVAGIVADFHYAPTHLALQQLLKEGVPQENILLTGNTVVDAIEIIRQSEAFLSVTFKENRIQRIVESKLPVVLITCHRRENQNAMSKIIDAVKQLSVQFPQTFFVWPVHANPEVQKAVNASGLGYISNVVLCEPLNYLEILKLMSVCTKIITDSGGIQEEAPSFRVPVLVLRDATERPESQQHGFSVLVGHHTEKIVSAFHNFKIDASAKVLNPFGDGQAALRIVHHLTQVSAGT